MTTKIHSHSFKRIIILAIVFYGQLPAMDPSQLYSKEPRLCIAPYLVNPTDFKAWQDAQERMCVAKPVSELEWEEETSSSVVEGQSSSEEPSSESVYVTLPEYGVCQLCRRTYSTQASLRSHNARYHGKNKYLNGVRASSRGRMTKGKPSYQCIFEDSDGDQCGKFFTLRPNAITHVCRFHLTNKSRVEAEGYILGPK